MTKFHYETALHKKLSFPSRISSVNVVTFTAEILDGKLSFFMQCD